MNKNPNTLHNDKTMFIARENLVKQWKSEISTSCNSGEQYPGLNAMDQYVLWLEKKVQEYFDITK